MIKKLIVIMAILMIGANVYAAGHVAKIAERKVAKVEVTEYRNGQQTSSYSYEPQAARPHNQYGQLISYNPVTHISTFSVDPSRVVIDASGRAVNIDQEGDPRGPENYSRFAWMLFILLPFALIGLVPAYSDKAIFFEDAGEVALNCLWAVGMIVFLMAFPTSLKDIGVVLFWVLAVTLITINVARSVSANPSNPILAYIIGVGKAPAAILGVFFMWANTTRAARRQTGESDTAFATRDLGAKIQGWATAGVIFMVLRSLVNGDRVRARRKGYNPYSHSFDGDCIYN